MRKKILVVDDNAELLELLALSIKSAGYAIATATDGLDALQKARTIEPDLIVLDLILPEMDGFAVCESLRRSSDTSKIPVIVLTGLCSQFARYNGMESGATDFICKPVTPSDLLARIEKLVGPGNLAEWRKRQGNN